MPTSSVEIRGLREFRTELRKADASLSNEMRKIHRRVSDLVGNRAKAAMSFGGRQSSKAARGIKSRSTNSSAFIDTVPKPAYALSTIWGQKRRSGWYANPRYAESTGRQFPDWVGNQWDPGEFGGKPYHIGDAINTSLDQVERIYLEGIDELTRRAFPS